MNSLNLGLVVFSLAASPAFATDYICNGEHDTSASFSLDENAGYIFGDNAEAQPAERFNCPVPTFRAMSQ